MSDLHSHMRSTLSTGGLDLGGKAPYEPFDVTYTTGVDFDFLEHLGALAEPREAWFFPRRWLPGVHTGLWVLVGTTWESQLDKMTGQMSIEARMTPIGAARQALKVGPWKLKLWTVTERELGG